MKYYINITHAGGNPVNLTICATDRYEAFNVALDRCSSMGLNIISISIDYVSV